MEKRAEEVATPRLATLLRKTGVTFKREYLEEMASESAGDLLSVMDVVGMGDDLFVADAAQMEKLKKLAMQAVMFSEPPAAASSVAEHRTAAVRPDVFIVPKPSNYVFGLHKDTGKLDRASAKEKERLKHEQYAEEIVALMSDSVREQFLAGYSDDEVPAAEKSKLLLKMVRGLAGPDQLRSARDALERLRKWLVVKYGSDKGLRVSACVMGWFLSENMVADDGDGHVSQSLIGGLKFAASKLKFPIGVGDSAVSALAKATKHVALQAPSVSVRVAYHFWQIASDVSYKKPIRAVSAVFLVMSLCGLRGIDAQRSAFQVKKEVTGGRSHFIAKAFFSKSATQMFWACPLEVFGPGTGWFEVLMEVWGSHDFMVPGIARGKKLAAVDRLSDSPASASIMLRYLREILQLPPLSMPAEQACRLRRHSFRHWIANCIRVLKFPPSDSFQGGRWKESGIMPLRYAQEVQMLMATDIITRVVDACRKRIRESGVAEWPVFGGWERLMGVREGFSAALHVDVNVEAAPSEVSEGDLEVEELGDGLWIEYEIDRIVEFDEFKDRFLVRWRGYGSEDDTWEPLEHLVDTAALVAFRQRQQTVAVQVGVPAGSSSGSSGGAVPVRGTVRYLPIGEAVGRSDVVRCTRPSRWSNPFPIRRGASREAVCEAYRYWWTAASVSVADVARRFRVIVHKAWPGGAMAADAARTAELRGWQQKIERGEDVVLACACGPDEECHTRTISMAIMGELPAADDGYFWVDPHACGEPGCTVRCSAAFRPHRGLHMFPSPGKRRRSR